ncbi:MAG: DNA primase [Candidatus Vogelbacteria bacterium CG10_big_fil_rev_8_21_14_0_10_51_16]|uniref:DNA primase n=1 Tax=Candidatus Vogelbacteria bacterium CG10_big_fil_rev_8_21_14_0_10_51_16 TaxID=1975045 RepID=A0A2H0RFK4_9BACT|nr:MAG: DNA primase [Candidatus Vogelbacteria bacterium CG10_big_fil_rev_8_21_14_0_10_51_16]
MHARLLPTAYCLLPNCAVSSLVEQIKSRVGILEVVESYIPVEKRGTTLKARCPFHIERTASFFISPARGSFYCFGCNKGGDIFTFIQEIEGVDFKDALRTLATRTGLDVEEFRESKQERDLQSQLRSILELAAAFYEKERGRYPKVAEYVRGRGITEETAKKFRIGYAPDGWRQLADYLKGRGCKEELAEEAGLLVRSERGWYDRFRNRIMFPIEDAQGRVVAFSGRLLPGDSKTSAQEPAKYINSPETPVYSKSAILYGYNHAKVPIRKSDKAILVEGQMDLVLSHQAGVTNAVAVSGTALTPTHLRLVGRLCHTLVMAFDQDVAGFNAARRGIEMALIDGFDIRIAILPHAKDPADLIRDNPRQWQEAVTNAEPVIDAVLAHVSTRELSESEKRRVVEHEVIPYIARLESALDKAHYLNVVAEFLHLPVEAVGASVTKYISTLARDASQVTLGKAPTIIEEQGEVKPQWRLVAERIHSVLAWQGGVASDSSFVGEARKRFDDLLGPERGALVLGAVSEAETFEAELAYEGHTDIIKEINELLDTLEETLLKEELVEALASLREAEKRHNADDIEKMVARCGDLSKRLQGLRSKTT